MISDHALFSSYEGRQGAANGQDSCFFSGMHRVLDGWMLARAPASPGQGFHHLHGPPYFNFPFFCMMCVFVLSSHLLTCGRTSRRHTGGRSRRISPPSFCGACLNFYREKDSAVLFPLRPRSRILCTHEVIVLHLLLGMMRGKIQVRMTAPRLELVSQLQKVSRLPTEPLGRPVWPRETWTSC